MVNKITTSTSIEIKPFKHILENIRAYPGKKGIIIEWESSKTAPLNINKFMRDTTALIIGIGLTKSGFYPKPYDYFSDIWKLLDWDNKTNDKINSEMEHLKDFYRHREGTNPENSLIDLARHLWIDLKDNLPEYTPDISEIQKNVIGFDTDPIVSIVSDDEDDPIVRIVIKNKHEVEDVAEGEDEVEDVAEDEVKVDGFENQIKENDEKSGGTKIGYIVDYSHPVMTYWKEWGPLFKINNKKTTYNQIILWGLSAFLWISFYPLPFSKKRQTPELEVFNKFFMEKISDLNQGKYWEANLVNGELAWHTREKRTYSAPILSFPRPPYRLNQKEKVEWIRKSIGYYLATYMSKEQIQFEFKIKNNKPYFVGSTDNLFLFWIMELFNKGTETKYCFCGCGEIVPPNRIKFATKKCAEKFYNREDLKKSKATIRSWKNRNKITEESFEKLYDIIEKEYVAGATFDDISRYLTFVRENNYMF